MVAARQFLGVGSVLSPDHASCSYIGGVPMLPPAEAVPTCDHCNAVMTFFLQFEIDMATPSILSLFACTSCANEGSLIPPLPPGSLRGAAVTERFLREAQPNWRALVLPIDGLVPTRSYGPRLECRKIAPAAERKGAIAVVGSPVWLVEDEAPASCVLDGGTTRRMVFLGQVLSDVRFPRLAAAPYQIGYSALRQSEIELNKDHYSLFLGNAVYIYGVEGTRLVYALVQKP
jgi:hypothetical protein